MRSGLTYSLLMQLKSDRRIEGRLSGVLQGLWPSWRDPTNERRHAAGVGVVNLTPSPAWGPLVPASDAVVRSGQSGSNVRSHSATTTSAARVAIAAPAARRPRVEGPPGAPAGYRRAGDVPHGAGAVLADDLLPAGADLAPACAHAPRQGALRRRASAGRAIDYRMLTIALVAANQALSPTRCSPAS